MTSEPQAAGPQPVPQPRNLIAIASGKGGVGKTWFSITLAHALARQSRRVLLFDGDLGLANIDVQLGLIPTRDIVAVLDGRITLRQAAQTYVEGGFDVVAGRSGTAALSAIQGQRLAEIAFQILQVTADYDMVLLDLGAGVDKTVRSLSAIAGTTIVVVTEEPTSLTDGYAFIKLAHQAGHASRIRLVVNMATSQVEADRTYNHLRKACLNFLKLDPPLLGVVRRDARVKDAIRAQTPLLTRSPNTEAAVDVERIAYALLHPAE